MKYLQIIMLLSLALFGDEINRVEMIVEDIESLKKQYLECKKELDKQTMYNIIPRTNAQNNDKKEMVEKEKTIQNYKQRLDKQIFRNTLLLTEIDSLRKLNKVDKSNNKLNNILKNKEKEIIYLKNKIIKLNKSRKKDKNNLAFRKKEPSRVQKDTSERMHSKEVTRKMKPTTFRLVSDSDILTSINGQVVYNWSKGATFTSNIATQNWIKITGHFNTGKWKPVEKSLWIKKENTIAKTRK